ncbi:MAG: Holliday junction resolvase RuvX [Patescibacteria group bacterium]
MNILGVDYGEKRIGLAWMDTGLDVVLPFGIILNESESDALAKLTDLVKKEKIDEVVFGLPFNLDGTENGHTKQIRNFAELFQNRTDVKIDYVNEMFSSQQADQMGGGVSRDEKAAMVILESYKNKK